MSLASRLKQAVMAAGVAITDVQIGDDGNKATWKVRPTSLQGAAQATIDAFNATDPSVVDAEKTLVSKQLDTMYALQAIAQLDYEERQKLVVIVGQTLRTAQECKDRVKAIYKSLLP